NSSPLIFPWGQNLALNRALDLAASHTPSAKFPCRCPDRTHMSSGRDDFDSLRRAVFAGRAGCGWILQGDDCIFYISVVYWKATETTLTKGGTNGTDAKDDPPGKALGPVRRGQ